MGSASIGATTFWDQASTGVSHRMRAGSLGRQVAPEIIPLGEGEYHRIMGRFGATHAVEFVWKVSNPGTLRVAIDALVGQSGILNIPVWGSIPRVTVAGVEWQDPQKTRGNDFLVAATIAFRQRAIGS